MGNEWVPCRLQHDASVDISKRLVACIENCLRPEERADCFAAFFEIVQAGIGDYEARAGRQLSRLYSPPGSN